MSTAPRHRGAPLWSRLFLRRFDHVLSVASTTSFPSFRPRPLRHFDYAPSVISTAAEKSLCSRAPGSLHSALRGPVEMTGWGLRHFDRSGEISLLASPGISPFRAARSSRDDGVGPQSFRPQRRNLFAREPRDLSIPRCALQSR